MVLKYEKPLPPSNNELLKYRVFAYYQPLSHAEKEFIRNLFAEVMGTEKKTFYRWVNCPLYNEDGTPHEYEIPHRALAIFAKLFGLNSSDELLNYAIDIQPLHRYDNSLINEIATAHSIKVPGQGPMIVSKKKNT